MKKDIITLDSNSYLLLDTNVIQHLAGAYYNIKNPKLWAQNFYQQIQDKKIQLIVCDLTMFEFLRGSTSLTEYLEKLRLLEEIFHYYIAGVETNDIIETTRIANIYEFKQACKKREPSFVDLFLVSILKNLADKNIILATFNHLDFPILFLDREIQPIDMGYEIENLCFYKFSKQRYKNNLVEYIRATYSKNRTKKKDRKK
ncbi:hypothetical protein KKG71_02560 [Patescibacteria group bacterium]|nr:hypothetical protein [Patescibacteria group bacterium]